MVAKLMTTTGNISLTKKHFAILHVVMGGTILGHKMFIGCLVIVQSKDIAYNHPKMANSWIYTKIFVQVKQMRYSVSICEL